MIEQIIIIVLSYLAGLIIGYSLGLARGKKIEKMVRDRLISLLKQYKSVPQ
jgi:hypothetical protein